MKGHCICVYTRAHAKAPWVLALIHPACPRHGHGGHWTLARKGNQS